MSGARLPSHRKPTDGECPLHLASSMMDTANRAVPLHSADSRAFRLSFRHEAPHVKQTKLLRPSTHTSSCPLTSTSVARSSWAALSTPALSLNSRKGGVAGQHLRSSRQEGSPLLQQVVSNASPQLGRPMPPGPRFGGFVSSIIAGPEGELAPGSRLVPSEVGLDLDKARPPTAHMPPQGCPRPPLGFSPPQPLTGSTVHRVAIGDRHQPGHGGFVKDRRRQVLGRRSCLLPVGRDTQGDCGFRTCPSSCRPRRQDRLPCERA